MPTPVDFLDVTGPASRITYVGNALSRVIGINLGTVIGIRIAVLFTTDMPLFTYPDGTVHKVRGQSDRSLNRIRIRHGCTSAINHDLGAEETAEVLIHELFHWVDYKALARADRNAIMAALTPAVPAHPLADTFKVWKSRAPYTGGYWKQPNECYAEYAVHAFSDVQFTNPYKRTATNKADFIAAVTANLGGTNDDDGTGDTGSGNGGEGTNPPQSSVWYRPSFVSQFDAPDASATFEKKNCVFATGAMALDRHTSGAVRMTAQQLRLKSDDRTATGASISNLKYAWAHAGDGYALAVSKQESWSDFIAKVRAGHGAVVLTNLSKFRGKYACTTPINVGHAVYVNEIRSNGDLLVFDPVCRPSDHKKTTGMTGVYDPSYANIKSEAQPKWMPQSVVRAAGEAFNSRPGIIVGYTKATQSGFGTGVAGGDAYVVWREGEWKSTIDAASQPGGALTLSDYWDAGPELREGFIQGDGLTISDPEVVILGEEGRVDEWSPTRDGYGVKARAYYEAKIGYAGEKPTFFRTRKNRWHLVPWDVPIEFFFLDQPEWPEGKDYLTDLIERANRTNSVQALMVVNRANIWKNIELGALLTIRLGLEGPHPDGLSGTVRVVGFSPNEDEGTMQLMCEWVGNYQSSVGTVDAIEDVIAVARSMIGVPYLLGAESLTHCDCSGLVYRSFINGGWGNLIDNRRLSSAGYTRYFADMGRFTTNFAKAERGDLIVYKHHGGGGKVVHIGIYLGNDRIVGALTTTGVTKTHYNTLDVDFYGVLKPRYPERDSVRMAEVTAETYTDPEEAVTASESLPWIE